MYQITMGRRESWFSIDVLLLLSRLPLLLVNRSHPPHALVPPTRPSKLPRRPRRLGTDGPTTRYRPRFTRRRGRRDRSSSTSIEMVGMLDDALQWCCGLVCIGTDSAVKTSSTATATWHGWTDHAISPVTGCSTRHAPKFAQVPGDSYRRTPRGYLPSGRGDRLALARPALTFPALAAHRAPRDGRYRVVGPSVPSRRGRHPVLEQIWERDGRAVCVVVSVYRWSLEWSQTTHVRPMRG
jgi:hypothetical protein